MGGPRRNSFSFSSSSPTAVARFSTPFWFGVGNNNSNNSNNSHNHSKNNQDQRHHAGGSNSIHLSNLPLLRRFSNDRMPSRVGSVRAAFEQTIEKNHAAAVVDHSPKPPRTFLSGRGHRRASMTPTSPTSPTSYNSLLPSTGHRRSSLSGALPSSSFANAPPLQHGRLVREGSEPILPSSSSKITPTAPSPPPPPQRRRQPSTSRTSSLSAAVDDDSSKNSTARVPVVLSAPTQGSRLRRSDSPTTSPRRTWVSPEATATSPSRRTATTPSSSSRATTPLSQRQPLLMPQLQQQQQPQPKTTVRIVRKKSLSTSPNTATSSLDPTESPVSIKSFSSNGESSIASPLTSEPILRTTNVNRNHLHSNSMSALWSPRSPSKPSLRQGRFSASSSDLYAATSSNKLSSWTPPLTSPSPGSSALRRGRFSGVMAIPPVNLEDHSNETLDEEDEEEDTSTVRAVAAPPRSPKRTVSIPAKMLEEARISPSRATSVSLVKKKKTKKVGPQAIVDPSDNTQTDSSPTKRTVSITTQARRREDGKIHLVLSPSKERKSPVKKRQSATTTTPQPEQLPTIDLAGKSIATASSPRRMRRSGRRRIVRSDPTELSPRLKGMSWTIATGGKAEISNSNHSSKTSSSGGEFSVETQRAKNGAAVADNPVRSTSEQRLGRVRSKTVKHEAPQDNRNKNSGPTSGQTPIVLVQKKAVETNEAIKGSDKTPPSESAEGKDAALKSPSTMKRRISLGTLGKAGSEPWLGGTTNTAAEGGRKIRVKTVNVQGLSKISNQSRVLVRKSTPPIEFDPGEKNLLVAQSKTITNKVSFPTADTGKRRASLDAVGRSVSESRFGRQPDTTSQPSPKIKSKTFFDERISSSDQRKVIVRKAASLREDQGQEKQDNTSGNKTVAPDISMEEKGQSKSKSIPDKRLSMISEQPEQRTRKSTQPLRSDISKTYLKEISNSKAATEAELSPIPDLSTLLPEKAKLESSEGDGTKKGLRLTRESLRSNMGRSVSEPRNGRESVSHNDQATNTKGKTFFDEKLNMIGEKPKTIIRKSMPLTRKVTPHQGKSNEILNDLDERKTWTAEGSVSEADSADALPVNATPPQRTDSSESTETVKASGSPRRGMFSRFASRSASEPRAGRKVRSKTIIHEGPVTNVAKPFNGTSTLMEGRGLNNSDASDQVGVVRSRSSTKASASEGETLQAHNFFCRQRSGHVDPRAPSATKIVSNAKLSRHTVSGLIKSFTGSKSASLENSSSSATKSRGNRKKGSGVDRMRSDGDTMKLLGLEGVSATDLGLEMLEVEVGADGKLKARGQLVSNMEQLFPSEAGVSAIGKTESAPSQTTFVPFGGTAETESIPEKTKTAQALESRNCPPGRASASNDKTFGKWRDSSSQGSMFRQMRKEQDAAAKNVVLKKRSVVGVNRGKVANGTVKARGPLEAQFAHLMNSAVQTGGVAECINHCETEWRRNPSPKKKVSAKLRPTSGPGEVRYVPRRMSATGATPLSPSVVKRSMPRRSSTNFCPETDLRPDFVKGYDRLFIMQNNLAATRIQALVRGYLRRQHTKILILSRKLRAVEEKKQAQLEKIRVKVAREKVRLDKQLQKHVAKQAEKERALEEKANTGKLLVDYLKKENAKIQDLNDQLRRCCDQLIKVNGQVEHRLSLHNKNIETILAYRDRMKAKMVRLESKVEKYQTRICKTEGSVLAVDTRTDAVRKQKLVLQDTNTRILNLVKNSSWDMDNLTVPGDLTVVSWEEASAEYTIEEVTVQSYYEETIEFEPPQEEKNTPDFFELSFRCSDDASVISDVSSLLGYAEENAEMELVGKDLFTVGEVDGIEVEYEYEEVTVSGSEASSYDDDDDLSDDSSTYIERNSILA